MIDEQNKKLFLVVSIVVLIFGLGIIVFGLVNLINNPSRTANNDVEVAGCPVGSNVQFVVGAKTTWFEGAAITSQNLLAPISTLNINCFASPTTQITGAIIRLTGPSGTQTFQAPQADNVKISENGTYTASCVLNNIVCNSDSFTIGGAQKTCYRCTSASNDANTCEAFTTSSTTCPSGSSESATGCAQAAGGSCPVALTCYRCTSATNDANTCESFQHIGSSCPVGTSSSANGCATAAGGSCPTGSGGLTCYRCTAVTSDGNACESFFTTSSTCPNGSSTSVTGCAAAAGGSCPVIAGLPNTSLGDNFSDYLMIIFAAILIILGIRFVRMKIR